MAAWNQPPPGGGYGHYPYGAYPWMAPYNYSGTPPSGPPLAGTLPSGPAGPPHDGTLPSGPAGPSTLKSEDVKADRGSDRRQSPNMPTEESPPLGIPEVKYIEQPLTKIRRRPSSRSCPSLASLYETIEPASSGS